MDNGKKITDQTVSAFGVVVNEIEKTNTDVLAITEMVRKNVDIVSNAVSQLERISSVVEDNAQISQSTKHASSNMAEITEKLLELVEQ